MDLKELGVSPGKQKQFEKRDINTAEDLIKYVPKDYLDLTNLTGILPADKVSCLLIKGESVRQYYGRVDTLVIRGKILPGGEKISITLFNQAFKFSEINDLIHSIPSGELFFAGQLIYNLEYNQFECSKPVALGKGNELRKIVPVYRKIPGMSDDYLKGKIKAAWDSGVCPDELFTGETRKQFNLLPIREIYRKAHFPASLEEGKSALEELQLIEFIYFSYRVSENNSKFNTKSPYTDLNKDLYNKLKDACGFEFTKDQKKCIEGIANTIASGKRLHAVVFGNVGCGKSVIAQAACALSLSFGRGEAAILAPTETLARQHYSDFSKIFNPLGVPVYYLSSSLTGKEKKKVFHDIKTGWGIVIGTHSILSDEAIFNELRFCIIDEEQRFGIAQKETLNSKGDGKSHTLLLSATPIPRTLDSLLRGKIDRYEIHTMPEGRIETRTKIYKAENGMSAEERAARFMNSQIKKGRACFIIAPMIEEGEGRMEGIMSVMEAKALFERYFPDTVHVETLTGDDDKEKIADTMERFRKGEFQVLISTTIVETGVNIPNASCITILNAERFGLSQIHQLRGRVGRSKGLDSYCILISPDEKNQRLEGICSTTDGFLLSELDLSMRGSGDFTGPRQHGTSKFIRLAFQYPDLFSRAREIAEWLIKKGEKPQFELINEEEEWKD